MNAINKAGFSPAEAFQARPVPNDPELVAAYFRQVSSYEGDRLKWAYRMAGIGWTVAVAAGIVAGAACFAVAGLTPLKTTELIVLRVDEATGMTDRVYDVRGGEMAASEAEHRHWLWQYVLHRQGYSFAEAQRNFDVVNLMSTADVQRTYSDWFKGSNPQSPQVILGRTGHATLSWVSTTFIGPKLAQVRYVLAERKGDLLLPKKNMVATVAYDFSRGQISGSAVNINPRGFLVTSFRTDQENAQ